MINQMAVFNRELALDRVGGDEELLGEIVDLFLGEYPELLEQIQSAVNRSDATALHRSAHTLKGSLAAIGAEAAQQQAHELETSGRQGQLTGTAAMVTDLENLLGQLRQELGR
jgi:HPt (histidine-containing phosphotransfer) domain-containing protein